MASREELYAALRNADASGDAEGAKRLAAYIQSMPADSTAKAAPPKKDERSMLGNLASGVASGFADVGNTLINAAVEGGEAVKNAVVGPQITELVTGKPKPSAIKQWNDERRASLDSFNDERKDSTAFSVGRIGGNVAATLPVGGVLGAGAKALGASAPVVNALTTSGMRAGATSGVPNMLLRMAGGAATGGASAALIDPDSAGFGAAVGAALPPAIAGLGKAGAAAAKGLRGGGVSPEVRDLASRAAELGINVPADRLVNSKPMNALASALNYVPFSGRAAAESRMESQLNQAAARTFGQDSSNVTMALRKAGDELGAKFDDVLKNNSVNVSKKFLDDLTGIYNTAQKELGSDGLKAIGSQFDEIIAKGADGAIDGQAAYNIKRTLDRIGKRNTPEAFHALEMKRVLMDALNDSIGPEASAAFAKTRQQYGNMLALEKLAKNGVEGELSVARLANLQNINNQPLQEIADIAAQFVRPRESQHGAMQRAVVGMGAGTLGGLPGVAAAAGGGRLANMALNSNAAKNFLMRDPAASAQGYNALSSLLTPALVRSAPALTSSR